jgi:hypothetical protein
MSPFGGSDNIFVFAVSVVAGIRVLGNKLHLSYSASSIRSGVDPKCGSQHVAAASLQSTADRNAFLCSFCAQLLEIEEQLNERIGTASTRHSRTVWQLLEHLERMLKVNSPASCSISRLRMYCSSKTQSILRNKPDLPSKRDILYYGRCMRRTNTTGLQKGSETFLD